MRRRRRAPRRLSDFDRQQACHRVLLDVIRAAPTRTESTDYDAWVDGIVDRVTDAANGWAQRHGGQVVTRDEVAHEDLMACGHSDYATKLALRVAQRVVYGPPDYETRRP